jgi:hypothetical protein
MEPDLDELRNAVGHHHKGEFTAPGDIQVHYASVIRPD